MNKLILPSLLALVFLVVGFLMGNRPGPVFGNTLFIAGAIIIAAVVIAAAILDRERK